MDFIFENSLVHCNYEPDVIDFVIRPVHEFKTPTKYSVFFPLSGIAPIYDIMSTF
jgi:hypothetical protein